MDSMITIFTPTFNRGYILENAYNSLLKQKYKKFKWVIIDDGSHDNTRELINKWISDDLIEINYKYQENQGRFAAFNSGKEYFEGELVITLDSDDYLKDDALQSIVDFWDDFNEKTLVSGIIAYFEGEDGDIIGNEFPRGLEKERSYILYDKYGLTGDKFMIYRLEIMNSISYRVYPGERFGGDAVIFNKMNDIYPMALFHRKLCHREYQTDSITNNLKKHHYSSPRGMRDHYLDALYHEKYNKKNIIKHMIGFETFSIISGDLFFENIKKIDRKLLYILLYLPGYAYAIYLRYMNGRREDS